MLAVRGNAMKQSVILLVILALSCPALGRTWASKDGKSTEADLKSYDVASGRIVLIRNGREFRLHRNQLSSEDIAYLDNQEEQRLQEQKEVAAKEAEIVALENAKAGTVVKYTTDGEHALSYHCYYPQNHAYQTNLPLLILFAPTGRGRNIMNYFKPVGDAHDWIIVGCDGFKNGLDDDIGRKWFEEVLPHIEQNITHDSGELYMGGMSGGASRAYHYSAYFDRPWKGIVACGGWLGGSEYEGLEYRRKMAVAMINGNNDNGANGWVERDKSELGGRGCKVKLFQFDGGHVLPPSDVLIEAVEWIIDNRKES